MRNRPTGNTEGVWEERQKERLKQTGDKQKIVQRFQKKKGVSLKVKSEKRRKQEPSSQDP